MKTKIITSSKDKRKAIQEAMGKHRNINSEDDWVRGLNIIIDEVGKKLDLDKRIIDQAHKNVKKLKEENIHGDRLGLGAGIIFNLIDNMSLHEIHKKTGVSTATVQKRSEQLKEII